MDIERFREFRTLAECLNYSKAATTLFMTQPVLSRHIHDLEEQLSTKLLTRDTHRVELTPVGKVFYEESKRVLDAYDKAVERVNQASSGAIGNIRVGFLSAAVEPFLRDFVIKFTEEQPNVMLDYESMELDELIEAVKTQSVDVGFATHVREDKNLDIIDIFTDRLCVAASLSHPLSEKDEVEVPELSGLPIICLDRENNLTTYRFNERIFERHGAEFNVVKFVPNIDTGLFFASVNKGVFLLPEHLTHMVSEKSMKVIPIRNDDTRIRLNLISHKNNLNPLAPVFCESFAEFAKSNEGKTFH